MGNVMPALPSGDAVLYLGERRTPSGVPRLVLVTCSATENPARLLWQSFDAYTSTVAGWRGPQGLFTGRPEMASGPVSRLVPLRDGQEPKVRFFAGQCDPADSS